MFSKIREIVSGKKNRFKEGGFNLDLTYITNRVIAMSFPASGFIEKTYRNDIDEVKINKKNKKKNNINFN
jgi:phosphatidylinositol-3,4,5-trisphosphate 3-phosphatase and dual-specificity protein phosphatase PTEN